MKRVPPPVEFEFAGFQKFLVYLQDTMMAKFENPKQIW